MMDFPLQLAAVLQHAATYHGDVEIASRTDDGQTHRHTYRATWERARRVASYLQQANIERGDRVATLAWNTHRHLELYYGISGAGYVCHTLNPRLFPEQLGYIIRHAGDKIIFVDPTCLPALEKVADCLGSVQAIVVMADASRMPVIEALPSLVCYEDALARQLSAYEFPDLDERSASSLCYTSGTTGDPKGVLYSHRSSVLHALSICQRDVFDLSATDCVAPIVPLFHVNAWGLPYAAPMVGAKLALPGPKLDAESLFTLMEEEGVTVTAGVPTVWLGLLDWMSARGLKRFSSLRRVCIGGAALPSTLLERFERVGVTVRHLWGMTETSPVALTSAPKRKHTGEPAEFLRALSLKQGRPLFGVDISVRDDDGSDIEHDAKEFGTLFVRGPWIASSYFGDSSSAAFESGGWFNTGDVVNVDADGFVQIVDRSKDVIKSGGEWISSIELENIASEHPAIAEAAVVARHDEKWGERPVLVVVLRPGSEFSVADMQQHYAGRIAHWSIPSEVISVPALPHTATGKLLKTEIRRMVADRT